VWDTSNVMVFLTDLCCFVNVWLNQHQASCATFCFALVFICRSDHRLPVASSLVSWIREVFLFSSRLHLSPVSCSLRLSVEMIPWLRLQQKMTPPPFYSVNRRVVYCCQLQRPLCSHTLLHDHQSHCQRPHR